MTESSSRFQSATQTLDADVCILVCLTFGPIIICLSTSTVGVDEVSGE
jgi:hypothetical protein